MSEIFSAAVVWKNKKALKLQKYVLFEKFEKVNWGVFSGTEFIPDSSARLREGRRLSAGEGFCRSCFFIVLACRAGLPF